MNVETSVIDMVSRAADAIFILFHLLVVGSNESMICVLLLGGVEKNDPPPSFERRSGYVGNWFRSQCVVVCHLMGKSGG